MEQKTEDHSVKQNKITLKNAKIATRALHVGQEGIFTIVLILKIYL